MEKGYEATIRVGAVEYGRAHTIAWSEEATELDSTGFDNVTGWAEYDLGLKRGTIDISAFWVATAVAYVALRNAWTARTAVTVRFVDSTGAGKQVAALVTGMSDNIPVQGGLECSIRLRMNGAVTDVDGSS